MNSIDSFGKIDNIELHTVWDLTPFRNLSREILCNNEIGVAELYKNYSDSSEIKKTKFPQSIEITITYSDNIQIWECFQTQEWIDSLMDNINMYGSIIDNWASSKIEVTPVSDGQAVWTKKLYGLKFHMYSLTYKK